MGLNRTGLTGALFALAFGALAACGGRGDGEAEAGRGLEAGEVVPRSRADARAAERRERERRRAQAEAEATFDYTRHRIDVTGDQPLACFVFSAALDPEADYSPYVEFRPAFQPALSVNGDELCVGGLAFGDSRTAVLKPGLPAADGRTLERGEEAAISFDDRPPYVGFSGGGVILPRLEADGLAIETVNVDLVNISVSRINDRALAFKSITRGTESQEGRYSYLSGDQNPADVATPVWSGDMRIENKTNAAVVTVFPLADVIGELQPGSYFVEVSDAAAIAAGSGPPATARRWIITTDLALTAYRGAHGLDVTLRSLQSGQAVGGTKVQLIARNNEILAEGVTGADGRIAFGAALTAGAGANAPKLVTAYGDAGDFAVLDLARAPVDLASDAVGGRRVATAIDAYVYTERGIYRPGETVHVAGLVRDRAGRAVSDRPGSLVVYRPNGLEATRIRFDETAAGAVLVDYDLSRAASRGLWRAAVEIDGVGETGAATFSVEDFVPQRVAVELEVDDETPIRRGETRDILVDTRFLYGAPGAGLTVKAQARLEADPSPFEDFEGFQFGRHSAVFAEEIIELLDQTADGAGRAVLRLAPGGRGQDADRPLRLNTVVSALEPGGRAVSESVRVPYRPRPLYLGIRPGFEGRAGDDEPAGFEIAAVSAAGQALAARLAWRVVSIDYHYDWYREDDRWRWRRSRSVNTVKEGVVQTQIGGTATIEAGGLDWGDHELIVTGPNGAEASVSFWVGWGGRVGEDGVEAPDRVAVIGPSAPPAPGREAEIEVVAPYDGEAQIVVATDRVLSVTTRPVSGDSPTRLRLPVTEDWGEGAYVMVNVYSPRDAVLRAKPRRAVGVGYVAVDQARRTWDLSINADDVVRPGREELIIVDIEGELREPVYLTLAAVDEGILRLTKFDSPDAPAHFFGRKALGVSLYDDYGRLLDPNLGLPADVRTGGDQLGGEGLSVVPTQTVALFSGLVDVGRSRRAEIRFDLPDFNGELRLMAVAWSASGVGSADKSMIVRDPVAASLILPRFLAPGDEAVATASIDNVEGEGGVFEAALSTSGVVSAPGSSEVSVTLQPGERGDEPIRIAADPETGVSALSLSIDGPGGFSAAHDYQIETRSAFLPEARIDKALMQPGDTYEIDPALLDGLAEAGLQATVSFSYLPVDAGALYASLSRYPYGCTEQAVSRALPLLYSKQLIAMGADGDREDRARTNVQEAVNRILSRQSPDGAFGLWREGDRHASPWLGAYTADFLTRAKAEGYVVPQEALARAYDGLRNIAQGDAWRVYGYSTDVWESRWHSDTQARLMSRSAPYALYVLAKAGEADVSRLRYLHDRGLEEIESPLARAHLAAALAHMGDRARAANAFAAAEAALGYENNGDYYQTELRDLAGVLALAAETGFEAVTGRLADRLGRDTPDPDRLTTQEKAFLLTALNGLSANQLQFEIDAKGLGRGADNDRRYRLTSGQAASGEVSFTLGGAAPVYRTTLIRGAPLSPPPAAAQSLSAAKSFHTLQGAAVDLQDVDQGDQIVTVLRISPEERRTNPIIVADLLPAGLEIETALQPADGRNAGGVRGAFAWIGEIDRPNTAEARDDRFVAAIDVRDAPVALAYIVRAVTPGRFTLPGVVAEDMYRPEVFARSPASTVSIAPRAPGIGGER